MTATVIQTLNIINEKGLHARASAKFVETVEQFDAAVMVEKDGMEVSGDSIMGLLMLAASRGSAIRVTAKGHDAQKLSVALADLIDDFFGEGM